MTSLRAIQSVHEYNGEDMEGRYANIVPRKMDTIIVSKGRVSSCSKVAGVCFFSELVVEREKYSQDWEEPGRLLWGG